jgi:hypothetical protein
MRVKGRRANHRPVSHPANGSRRPPAFLGPPGSPIRRPAATSSAIVKEPHSPHQEIVLRRARILLVVCQPSTVGCMFRPGLPSLALRDSRVYAGRVVRARSASEGVSGSGFNPTSRRLTDYESASRPDSTHGPFRGGCGLVFSSSRPRPPASCQPGFPGRPNRVSQARLVHSGGSAPFSQRRINCRRNASSRERV